MTTLELEPLIQGRDTPIVRDLKLNLKKFLNDSSLTPDESVLTLVAIATSLGHAKLTELSCAAARAQGLGEAELTEAREVAGIMGMLNRYYRFRHFLETARGKEYLDANYRGAGLRMNSLGKPALGKVRFEMLALAVSVINGCEVCVTSHEAELLKHGVSAEKVHDLARLAASVAGLATIV